MAPTRDVGESLAENEQLDTDAESKIDEDEVFAPPWPNRLWVRRESVELWCITEELYSCCCECPGGDDSKERKWCSAACGQHYNGWVFEWSRAESC